MRRVWVHIREDDSYYQVGHTLTVEHRLDENWMLVDEIDHIEWLGGRFFRFVPYAGYMSPAYQTDMIPVLHNGKQIKTVWRRSMSPDDFKIDPSTVDLKGRCECGTWITGSKKHSRWCPEF